MRFHCGFSFSWRSIKKFLIPFLLGILAFFSFNFFQDNKIIPLGFIQVSALENDEYLIEDSSNNYEFVYESDNIEHKPLHDKIYWFDFNDSINGILSSIYILLFLYCISSLILRFITIIHNVRWKR